MYLAASPRIRNHQVQCPPGQGVDHRPPFGCQDGPTDVLGRRQTRRSAIEPELSSPTGFPHGMFEDETHDLDALPCIPDCHIFEPDDGQARASRRQDHDQFGCNGPRPQQIVSSVSRSVPTYGILARSTGDVMSSSGATSRPGTVIGCILRECAGASSA